MNHQPFETTLQKTDTMLSKIEETYGWEDRQTSYQALRAVLHTLRDRLTPELTSSLAAQLTLLVKGIYFDGWSAGKTPVKMNAEEFAQKVDERFTANVEVDIQDLIKTVMTAVANSIEASEVEKLQSLLPEDVANLLA